MNYPVGKTASSSTSQDFALGSKEICLTPGGKNKILCLENNYSVYVCVCMCTYVAEIEPRPSNMHGMYSTIELDPLPPNTLFPSIYLKICLTK